MYNLCIMSKSKLSSSERKFLSDVTDVIHANPFSEMRISADSKLADFPPNSTYEERRIKIIKMVASGVKKLFSEGKNDVRKFEGSDRILIENAVLYHVYNIFFPKNDELIESQISQGESPCKVPFAEEMISMIRKLGFSDKEALHYFAAFFQMRRAYYFIAKTIVGRSPCMVYLRESLWNNVITSNIGLYTRELWDRMEDYSTLILGETGTGKGMCAKAIGQSAYIPYDREKGHYAESFTSAFVAMNLSQFPEQLIESELFGHKKGSFTGAVSDYDGALARCRKHGAVFLDEIGEVPVPVQIKLLQVLEDREYSPVGSHEKKRFPGRIIAATNRPLDRLRAEGVFRDDFYYRLCSDVIMVPTLSQRIAEDPKELVDLVNHMVRRIVGDKADEIAGNVIKEIRKQVPQDYSWPGNVRELEQCIRRILLKRRYEIDLNSTPAGDIESLIIEGIKAGSLDAQTLLSHYCRILYDRYGSYEAVARRAGLDRRTAKKYIENWGPQDMDL
ncbi:MAG: sigma 54-interacting transcriptional regulator [Nitrospirota bacterium]|nr:MAG: sigma 54-interacting transcriptional regulator [Nitrospirota bacterium]